MGVSADDPFTGISSGTLDKKGRVCIPANYRHILAAQNANAVYIRSSLLTPSLECFGAQVMRRFHNAETQSDPFVTASHDIEAFALLTLSENLAIDETGRVRLPDSFIAHAGLSEDVTFIGIGSRFEIWDSARYAPIHKERLAAAEALLKSRQQRAPKP